LNGHAAVKAAGAQQRRVEDLGSVGRGEHGDRLDALKAIHLGQDLIERLLALVVPAGDRDRPLSRAADRVELVDEDDRRRRLLGLRKQVTHARRANADDRLDELRGRDRKERGMCFAGHRAREQRLARTRRAGQQHAVGHASTQAAVALGVAQEVDDLGQLGLRLIDAGDVGERDPDRGRVDPPRLRATKVAQCACRAAAGGSSRKRDEQADDQQRRSEPQQQRGRQRSAPRRRGGINLNLVGLQQCGQLVVVPERRHLGAELRRRRSLRVLGRVAHSDLQGALDGVARRGDRGDPARLHSAHEVGAKRHPYPRLTGRPHQQHRAQVQGKMRPTGEACRTRRRGARRTGRAGLCGSSRCYVNLVALARLSSEQLHLDPGDGSLV
jgi:hypothetical protein